MASTAPTALTPALYCGVHMLCHCLPVPTGLLPPSHRGPALNTSTSLLCLRAVVCGAILWSRRGTEGLTELYIQKPRMRERLLHGWVLHALSSQP